MRVRKIAIAASTAAVLTAAGCGSAKDTASSSSAATSPGPTRTLHGTPLKLGLIADGSGPGVPTSNLASQEAGVNAAVKAINGAGGVNGHPLQVVACDTQLSPNGAAACARKVVAQQVVAAVAMNTQFGADVIPILDAAHVASLGAITVGPADLTNRDGFPLAPTGLDIAAGEPALAAALGATKISLVRVDVPVAAQLPQLAAIGLAPHHLKLVDIVAIPPNSPDMSSYVAAATEHNTDAISIILGEPSDTISFVRAAQQAGYQGKLVSDAASLLRVFQSGRASAVSDVYSVDMCFPATDTANPAVQKMDAELSAAGSSVARDYSVEDAWASVYLFAQVAKTLRVVTASSVLAAMPGVTNFNSGVFPPINFSKPLTIIPGLHIYNPDVLFEQVRNGALVPVTGKFVNLLG